MRRFSIRSLMAVIIAVAIGLAALRNANEGWAGAMLLVALAAVGIAALRAVISRGKERYRQAGFAFACCAYLVVALGLLRPPPGTTRLLNYLRARMHPPLRVEFLSYRSITYTLGGKPIVVTRPVWTRLKIPAVGHAPDAFLRVGHCLLALLAGLDEEKEPRITRMDTNKTPKTSGGQRPTWRPRV